VTPAQQHLATRQAVGLFDFSFMSLCEIAGSGAPALLERLQTRALDGIQPGQLVYTLLLRDDGAVFIDATLWRHADGQWWLFTGRRSDIYWIAERAAGFDVRIRERSGELAVLAVQGPSSGTVLARFARTELVRSLRYFHFVQHGGTVIGRLGFSGELGYEIMLPADQAPITRKALLDAGRDFGIVECSFAAADSLRIESGYVLFGKEIDGRANPRELRLERLVSSPPKFGLTRKLLGLEILDRPPRADLPLAQVTSECFSPVLGRQIALGFGAPEACAGDHVRLADGRLAAAVRLPFYDPGRRLPRSAPL
jgi:glycine cleavage system T protein (aminomethyltransferase)